MIARHTALLVTRDPGPMIGYTLMPLLLMAVLRPLYGALYPGRPQSALAQLAPGLAVMFALFALKVVGAGLLDERIGRTWDRLAAGPARPGEILVGKALPFLGMVLVQQAVLLGVAWAAFGLRPRDGWALVAGAAFVWSLAILAAGTAAARFARSPAQLSAAGDVAAIAVTCLSGALVPRRLLPGWASAVAPYTPGYWGLRVYQQALRAEVGSLLRAAAILLAIALLSAALAVGGSLRGAGR